MGKILVTYTKCRKNFSCRVVMESFLPICGGILWGVIAWHAKQTWFDALSAFGIGFFFLLALQGQVLRIDKNVRDDQDSDEFKNSFSTLQQAVDEIRSHGLVSETQAAPPVDAAPTLPVDAMPTPVKRERQLDSAKQFSEAQYILAMHLPFQGALGAAVAFESAVREVAEQLGLDPHQPLSQLIRELAGSEGNEDKLATLLTLVRVRNNVVHAEAVQRNALTQKDAEELFQSFKRGALLLKSLLNDFRRRRIDELKRA